MKRMILPIVIVFVALNVATAKAEFYEYTDNEGVVHFVDDVSRIPKKYQKQKKVRSDDQDSEGAGESLETKFAGKSFEQILRMAKRGDVQAQTQVGIMYMYGDGVEENKREGIKWFSTAAAKGYASAQFCLGKAYHFGDGVDRDVDKAEQLYLSAAEQGQPSAQGNLGALYATQNKALLALKWYTRAAENGNSIAMKNLGEMYEKGAGVQPNMNIAEKWYRKAKEAGVEGEVIRRAER